MTLLTAFGTPECPPCKLLQGSDLILPDLMAAVLVQLPVPTHSAKQSMLQSVPVMNLQMLMQNQEYTPVDVDSGVLANAVSTGHGLEIVLWVPVRVKDDDCVSCGQVDPETSSTR